MGTDSAQACPSYGVFATRLKGYRTTAPRHLSCGGSGAVYDGGHTVAQAGRDLGLSWPITQRCLTDDAARPLPADPPPAEAIGIDETRRGKPVWRQNPHTRKWELIADAWHIGFVDAVSGEGLFGQVEGRNAASVADWLIAQPAVSGGAHRRCDGPGDIAAWFRRRNAPKLMVQKPPGAINRPLGP
ncbi:hypothetical protein ACFWTE_19965 [Nocardiopsis sp. NPDC058631]|uniref:hypothetical protein n=1 Tax=Nocardiopsis sp. NPDC058631 TaxID=3346566 RepID=UPI0036595708